jgi:hypothetical protein
MGKVISFASKQKSHEQNNNIALAPDETGSHRNEKNNKHRNKRIFDEHLLGLIESALSLEPKSEFERARARHTALKGNGGLPVDSKGFDPSRLAAGEAVFLRHVIDSPLSESDVAHSLSIVLKEIISRAFIYERKMTPDQRREARKKLEQTIIQNIIKKL